MFQLSYHIAIGAALLTAASAIPFDQPDGYHRFAPRSNGIKWRKCDEAPTRQCGRFEVPLDYHNATAGKASLAVARLRATKKPKLGTIFLNPGGPGESGIELVTGELGDTIMKVVGGRYDLVSWDPRGVGMTHPRSACFATGTEENAFWEGTIPRAGLEAKGNFTEQADLDAFYAQVPEVDELLLKLGQKCVEYSPDTFQYVGTAATTRDMVALHDYLEGPDKPVDYWGFSYGTAIGIYFANMFPDRVGRVVIDGVVDPVYWANKPAYEIWSINVESADEALTGFVTACAAAGPDNCAIAFKDSTPDSLREDIRRILDLAYDYTKAAGTNALFTSAGIRSVIFQGMYTPEGWPKLADTLLQASNFLTNGSSSQTSQIKRSLELLDIPRRKRSNSTNEDPAPNHAIQAITCADAVDAGDTTTQMVFDELVNVTRNVSPMFGPMFSVAGFYCHRWPVRAVERYTGPWNKKLSNPIIVIGNKADPVTPFRSAKSVADALGESAVLIEQDKYGHTSLAMHSNCTINALNRYFLKNKLPSADRFCRTNQQLFPPNVTKSTIAAL